MAVVNLNVVGSLYGPGHGTMPSTDFAGWNYAAASADGTTAILNQNVPANPYQIIRYSLEGTGLAITPDTSVTDGGADISARIASGTVTSLKFISGDRYAVNTYYTITDISISFASLVAHSSDFLPFLLSGADVVTGTSFDENMYGYGGDDILLPGIVQYVDRSPDVVDGGAGTDTVSFSNLSTPGNPLMSSVNVNLTTGWATGIGQGTMPQVRAQLISIENATGGYGDDILTGNNLANVLDGGAGNDRIYGGAGNDTLFGGVGNDYLDGSTGGDTLYGGAGNDTLLPGTIAGSGGFIDIVDGGDGVDTVRFTGTAAVNINLLSGRATGITDTNVNATLISIENVLAGWGNDVIIGGTTRNAIFAGAGNDQVFGMGGNDRLEGQAGDDALFGGVGHDTVGGGDGNDGVFGETGNDNLYGGNGNDYLSGGDGDDVLWGDVGNDQIDAGAGNDFVVLGAGDDTFTLGSGNDRIRFDYGNGQDTITDFGNGLDVLDFTATGMTLEVLQANAVDTAQGVLLNLGSGSVLLAGLSLYQLEWNTDFVFAA